MKCSKGQFRTAVVLLLVIYTFFVGCNNTANDTTETEETIKALQLLLLLTSRWIVWYIVTLPSWSVSDIILDGYLGAMLRKLPVRTRLSAMF